MPGITGMGNTFNLPNYTGQLITITPADTPLLSMAGGLTGGRPATQKDFEWQTSDLRDPEIPAVLEGANAPTAQARVRANITNTVQIFHKKVEVSYTKQAAVGQRDGLGSTETNPVGNEMNWQILQELKQLARDVNYTFINGVYAKPVNNDDARKTRGILQAIVSNHISALSDDQVPVAQYLSEAMVLDMMQLAWENGGLKESETATLICNGSIKRQLTKIFVTDKDYEESSRNVGGVNLQTIETDFGKVNIMLDRAMPKDTLAVLSVDVIAPRILYIPGKGFFFEEPLAKTGASDAVQLYGEIGLEYGHEKQHAKITDIKFDTVTAYSEPTPPPEGGGN